MEPALLFAIIGVLGVGSQWLAWRLQLPAIVLMLAAGLIAGPITGLINPAEDFGELFRPIVSVAVAVILFEGGLTLHFHELRESSKAVRRLVYIGAPLGWALSTLACHYAAGLSWESSLVLGGILIVTGPTVITPMLRQARLAQKPASVLKWEAIINDPIGALAAVLAFELFSAFYGAGTLGGALGHLAYGISWAVILGYAAGWFLARVFIRGYVPEYMKVPVLFAVLLAVYAVTDVVLHESGLLAVTVMGVYMANANMPSLEELKRFKEHVTILLVSGVFILLASDISFDMIASLDMRALLFVLAIVFVARPITVLVSLMGTSLTWQERAMVAWIGPRGVVAVAVSGLFGARLVELGVEDGAMLPALAFVLVAATVVLHGFSMGPLARILGLTSREVPGVMFVGGSRWVTALAQTLMAAKVPVLIADRNYFRLRSARQEGVANFHGEILSERAEHHIEFNRYGTLITATDNDAYNALICTDFAPEFGRNEVFQIGRHERREGGRDLPITLGGRTLGEGGLTYEDYSSRLSDGWVFVTTRVSEEYPIERYREQRPEAVVIGVLHENGEVEFAMDKYTPKLNPGDSVIAFAPPQPEKDAEAEARREARRAKKQAGAEKKAEKESKDEEPGGAA
ncbi:cation:proton antiporter [Paracoccaceae bacterium GXU_MW_L88]